MHKVVNQYDGAVTYYLVKGSTILHRLDGPAIERSNGYGYYVMGVNYRSDGPCGFFSDQNESKYRFHYRISPKLTYVTAKEFAKQYMLIHLCEYTFEEEKKLGWLGGSLKEETKRYMQR